MNSHQTALVLGASGGIGGEVARLLAARGWTVRALHRNPDLSAADKESGFVWVKGDAMSAADVVAAAEGASAIVHAVNPSGYRNWGRLVLPMLDNTIAAAHATGARIVLPGSVYNFGPDAFPEPRESSPQHPVSIKGRIRVEMERRLRAAADAGTPVLIVRAGDFFGPTATNNSWFSGALVKAGRPVASITDPGKRGIGHQWAYLPDVAETVARLLETSDVLEGFAVFHMEGHWDADGTQMISAIRKAAGNPDIKVRKLPWLLLRLLSPFVPLFRELVEMRYLWTTPIRMSNERLKEVLGAEPHTPLDLAVRGTLIGIGCMPTGPSRQTVSSGSLAVSAS
jgi:nucleoside-diphosphate-sugar epimerase